jgi:galactokinase
VNLIGEHTDYNEGFVLPVALDLACLATIVPHEGSVLRVRSRNLQAAREWDVRELDSARPAGEWSDYVAGVAQQILRQGLRLRAGELVIHSEVPIGAGLSSSASFEVATALALIDEEGVEPELVAHLCHRAENEFVGLPCGIMDHFISLFGREGHALLLDCRDLSSRAIPIPAGAVLLAVNSMVKHELGQSAYATRVAECRSVAAAFGVASLRDLSTADVAAPPRRVCETGIRRARHIARENQRVLDFADAATRGDVAGLGRLMSASHRSLRDDYEVSCAELDFLVDVALSVPGVYGARMTGGGFGGCTVNLMEPAAEAVFRDTVSAAYRKRFGHTPEIYRCKPSSGAGQVR